MELANVATSTDRAASSPATSRHPFLHFSSFCVGHQSQHLAQSNEFVLGHHQIVSGTRPPELQLAAGSASRRGCSDVRLAVVFEPRERNSPVARLTFGGFHSCDGIVDIYGHLY